MSCRDFFEPSWENTNVVLIDAKVLRQAEQWVKSCEACTPDKGQIPFDWVLDRITGCDASVTDYVLAEPATCPHCKGPVLEKTLIDLRDDAGSGGTDSDVPQPPIVEKA